MFTFSTKQSIAVIEYILFAIGHVYTRSDKYVFTLNIDISSNSLVLELCTIDTTSHIEMLTSRFLERSEIMIPSI